MLKNLLKISKHLSNPWKMFPVLKEIVYQAKKIVIRSLFVSIRFKIDQIVHAWQNITVTYTAPGDTFTGACHFVHIFILTCWNQWILGEFRCFSSIWGSWMIKLYLNFMLKPIVWWILIYHILSSKVQNFYIENDAEIFPAHYTWKVTEKRFKWLLWWTSWVYPALPG
jgi:hypothetical protein